jgi:hypothetical protein
MWLLRTLLFASDIQGFGFPRIQKGLPRAINGSPRYVRGKIIITEEEDRSKRRMEILDASGMRPYGK